MSNITKQCSEHIYLINPEVKPTDEVGRRALEKLDLLYSWQNRTSGELVDAKPDEEEIPTNHDFYPLTVKENEVICDFVFPSAYGMVRIGFVTLFNYQKWMTAHLELAGQDEEKTNNKVCQIVRDITERLLPIKGYATFEKERWEDFNCVNPFMFNIKVHVPLKVLTNYFDNGDMVLGFFRGILL